MGFCRLFLIWSALCGAIILLQLSPDSALADGPDITIYTEDFPPYNFLKEDGTVGGISTTRVRSILAESGLSYEIVLLPWPRTRREAMSNPSGLLYSIFRTKTREEEFDWLATVARPDFYLFARASDNRLVSKASILAGAFTAVCVDTDASCDILREAGFKDSSLYREGGGGLTETIMVRYKRADLYLGDLNHHPYRMRMLGLDENVSKPVYKVASEAMYLAAGNHVRKELRDAIREAALRLDHR